MINKTYSVSEIILSKEEIDVAIKEYIEKHNNPRIIFPKSVTYAYNVQDNKLNGISVKLVFKDQEKIPNELITELPAEEQDLDQDLKISKSKTKKSSKPLFSRGGLLPKTLRVRF
jgi:hypothetical protein